MTLATFRYRRLAAIIAVGRPSSLLHGTDGARNYKRTKRCPMTVKFAFGAIVPIGFLTTWSVLCAAEPESLTKFCPATEPLLVKATGAVEILSDRVLASRAIGCVAPKLPALARQARLEGYVLVGVLVNEAGLVTCVHLISGHPLLVGSAIDAARQWIFRPVTQNGRTVSVYGVLAFHYSTGGGKKRSCLDAHW